MNPSLKLAITVAAIVVVPVVLYLLIGWIVSRRREKCPQCGEKKLRFIQGMLATVIIDDKRAPDSWNYLACESCHSHWKEHHGELSAVADDEWRENRGTAEKE